MEDQKDNIGISKLNIRPQEGLTKDFDQLPHNPKETSDFPLDDAHEDLPDDK